MNRWSDWRLESDHKIVVGRTLCGNNGNRFRNVVVTTFGEDGGFFGEDSKFIYFCGLTKLKKTHKKKSAIIVIALLNKAGEFILEINLFEAELSLDNQYHHNYTQPYTST